MIAQVTEGSEIHRFRRWSRYLLILLLSTAVLAVLASGIFRAVMLVAPSYRQDLAAWVSELAGKPVEVGAMSLVWREWQPNLSLESLALRDPDSGEILIRLDQANLAFSPLEILTGSFEPVLVELFSPSLVIERSASGDVGVRGIAGAARNESANNNANKKAADPGALLTALRAVGNVRIVEGRVEWIDLTEGGESISLTGLNLALNHSRSQSEATLSILLPESLGGEINARLDISGDLAQFENWAVQGELDVDSLIPWRVLKPWLKEDVALSGALHDLAVTLDYRDQRLQRLAASVSVASLQGYLDGQRQQLWRSMAAELELSQRVDDWRVDITDLQVTTQQRKWPPSSASATWVPDSGAGSGLQLELGFLDLADVSGWVRAIRFPEDVAEKVDEIIGRNPTGALSQIRVSSRQKTDEKTTWTAAAKFDSLGIDATATSPGIAGLGGYLQSDERSGELSLTSTAASLDIPARFTQPIPVQQIRGLMRWQVAEEFWRVETDALAFDLAGLESETQFSLSKSQDDEAPLIDLKVALSSDDATLLKPLLPTNWSEGLRNWLGRSVRKATVPTGEVVIRGPVNQMPYRDGGGEYRIDLQIRDAEFEYAQRWPLVKNIDARLVIDRDRLTVDGVNADTLDVQLTPITAVIPKMGPGGQVQVKSKLTGQSQSLLRFLKESPLQERYAKVADTLTASGPITGDLDLTFKFGKPKETEFDLALGLHGVGIAVNGLDEPFEEIIGPLQINTRGLSSSGLRAVFAGQPMQATLQPFSSPTDTATSIPTTKRWTRLEAASPITFGRGDQGLLRYVPEWLRPYLGGETSLSAELFFGEDAPPGVFIKSDLRGVLVALPQPLGKFASDARNLSVHLLPEESGLTLDLNYGDPLAGRFIFAKDSDKKLSLDRATMRLGAASMPSAEAGVLNLAASAKQARFDEWQPVIARIAQGGAQGSSGRALQVLADVQIDDFLAFGQNFPNQRMALASDDVAWRIRLDGPDATGTLISNKAITPSGRPEIIAALDRLQWAPPARIADEDSAQGEVATNASISASAIESITDPARLPALILNAENFQLGEVPLGQLRMETVAVLDGVEMTNFKLTGSPVMSLSAKGEWRRSANLSRAFLSGEMNSADFGAALALLGYERSVIAKDAQIKAELNWLPSAAGIELEQANGAINVAMKEGSLMAIDPGAGRMLGLFSVNALPRRLFLDFSDVTEKGMAFDDISGDFRLSAGDAFTDNLTVKSPSLKMESKGRIGLAAKDYDQQITIYPDATSSLAVAGTVIGGPAAGIILLLAQELLDKPMDQATQLSYQLTGPWSDPVVSRR